MPDPAEERRAFAPLLASLTAAAEDYLASLDEAPVRTGDVDGAAERFNAPLPEDGKGSADALDALLSHGLDAHVRSSGPRFFHFVIGGATPAALAADWLTSLIDQNPGLWTASPLGA